MGFMVTVAVEYVEEVKAKRQVIAADSGDLMRAERLMELRGLLDKADEALAEAGASETEGAVVTARYLVSFERGLLWTAIADAHAAGPAGYRTDLLRDEPAADLFLAPVHEGRARHREAVAQALAAFRKCLTLDEHSAAAWYSAGYLCQAGSFGSDVQPAAAEEAFSRALEIEPDGPYAAKAAKHLFELRRQDTTVGRQDGPPADEPTTGAEAAAHHTAEPVPADSSANWWPADDAETEQAPESASVAAAGARVPPASVEAQPIRPLGATQVLAMAALLCSMMGVLVVGLGLGWQLGRTARPGHEGRERRNGDPGRPVRPSQPPVPPVGAPVEPVVGLQAKVDTPQRGVLPLREQASNTSRDLGSLANGTLVGVRGIQGDWLRVGLRDGGQAWARWRYNDAQYLFTVPYVLPYSNHQLVTEDDIARFGPEQLALARNEIFARHGYVFTKAPYRDYFALQPWYQADSAYDDDRLTDVEKANVHFLWNHEPGH